MIQEWNTSEENRIPSEESGMSPKEMIRFLKNMQSYETYLKKELEGIHTQAESFESAVARRSYPTLDLTETAGTGSYETDRNLQILLDAREDIEREYEMISQRRKEIYAQQDRIMLVKRCISLLPYDYQEILNYAFVRGEGWRGYIHKKCICQSYYYRLRKEAIQMLCDCYNEACLKKGRTASAMAAEPQSAYLSDHSV